mgnify:CR=1 FL=1
MAGGLIASSKCKSPTSQVRLQPGGPGGAKLCQRLHQDVHELLHRKRRPHTGNVPDRRQRPSALLRAALQQLNRHRRVPWLHHLHHDAVQHFEHRQHHDEDGVAKVPADAC